jgi:hypothetical protein
VSTYSLHASQKDATFAFNLDSLSPDPSPAEQKEEDLSLRHRLFQQQATLKLRLVFKLPSLPKDPAMQSIMPMINAAFRRRPWAIVPLDEPGSAQTTVGTFWYPHDFNTLPDTLQDFLK